MTVNELIKKLTDITDERPEVGYHRVFFAGKDFDTDFEIKDALRNILDDEPKLWLYDYE